MPSKAKDRRYPWRVVLGYIKGDDKTPWAYYVVRGEGENPLELEFDSHGAYILHSAAKESADGLNEMGKKSDKYARLCDRDTQLVRMKHVKGRG